MLNKNPLVNPQTSFSMYQSESNEGFALDLSYYWTLLRQQWPVVLLVAAIMIALAVLYCFTAQPKYSATATMMIDTRKNQLLQEQQVVTDQQLDTSGVESQVEVLKSESIALAVIRELKLVDDADFNSGRSLLHTVLNLFSTASGPSSEFEKERRAVQIFESNLTVKRIGLTYAIDITFTSPSAQKAAQVANAISDAYVVTGLDARYEATKRASRWLQDRIKDLREQANAAELRVQQFRADNNIVDTTRGLLSEQQIGDVNSQLITAKAATAEAKAKLDRIQGIASGDLPNASVADALKNDVITRLRAQYLDLAARESDLSSKYGYDHAAAVNLRNQMREIKVSIKDEISRIAETYKSDYEIAKSGQDSLENSLASLVTTAGTSGQAQVKLRDLESSAQSARNLYDSFLQRSLEATQQQTFPVSDSRLITAASVPLKPSAPKTPLIVLASAFLGLFVGYGVALARDRMDNVFRTVKQVQDLTGLECLGIIPRVKETPVTQAPDSGGYRRVIQVVSSLPRHVVEYPFSRFAETLRSLKVAADVSRLTREMKVIAIVSAVPHEGKSFVSANLAMLIAGAKNRVLLIDGDLRSPALTKSLAPHIEGGILEVLSGTSRLQDVICKDPVTGLDFLPAVIATRISHTAELLSSQPMAKLISEASELYDYVIVDLPPVASVVDVRAVASLIHGFVCVVEWGKTSRDIVLEALGSVELLPERMIGVVLNKASPVALKRLESYKGRYYGGYYSNVSAEV